MKNIKALPFDELLEVIRDEKEPAYRVRQIWEWIYRKRTTSFDQMHNLSLRLRERLNTLFYISHPKIEKIVTGKDGTQKLLISLHDGETIETVIISDNNRITVCISTQAGCRQGCKFCLTGRAGFRRDLHHYEICDQIVAAQRCLKTQISNIVLMGMGEPLDNFENTIQALKIITSPYGFFFSPKRITLSTVGLVPQIEQLQKENLKVKFALSLNAGNDRLRNDIMPINYTYPLSQLMKCLRQYPLKSRERITIEYLLMSTINDSRACAEELAQLLKYLKVKINLIPYNKNPYLPFLPPKTEIINHFTHILNNYGYHVTIRESKGGDILAGCGQLGYPRNKKIKKDCKQIQSKTV